PMIRSHASEIDCVVKEVSLFERFGKRVFFPVLFAMLSLIAGAAHAQIPSTLGWYSIPNTALRSVCPPSNFGGSGYDFAYYCMYVTLAWNSGVFDTKRNRLIVWGGGHGDYAGNEVYSVDLNRLTVQRLTDPGLPIDLSACSETVAGNQPCSRH